MVKIKTTSTFSVLKALTSERLPSLYPRITMKEGKYFFFLYLTQEET